MNFLGQGFRKVTAWTERYTARCNGTNDHTATFVAAGYSKLSRRIIESFAVLRPKLGRSVADKQLSRRYRTNVIQPLLAVWVDKVRHWSNRPSVSRTQTRLSTDK